MILTFSETIGSVDRTKITIGMGGGNVASTSAARVAGTKVELDLSTVIDATVMLTVALDLTAVEDGAGNDNLAVPATPVINAITDDPVVSSVALTSVPTNTAYAIGNVIEATVTFSAAVDITGTPQLELDFDGTPKPAACAAATNTTTMACRYPVAVNDSAPNGIAIAANTLTLNGGTIRATGSTTSNAALDHAAIAIDAGHKVDGIRPTLVTTGAAAPTTSPDGTQVILTFSETIGSVNRTKITIRAGGNVVSTIGQIVTGTKVLLEFTTALTNPSTTLTVELAVGAVEDAAGNENLALALPPPSNPMPSAPRNLVAIGGDEQVALTWDAPEDDGGFAITDYEVRIDGKGRWISIGSTDTTYTVTGLVSGTEYTFEVRAVNRNGTSRASNRAEATTIEALDFAHFANGDGSTSDFVFVNVSPHMTRPTLYFYDQEGQLMDPESGVDVTGDLRVTEDGALTVQTEMEPLGELTISTHGRGGAGGGVGAGGLGRPHRRVPAL